MAKRTAYDILNKSVEDIQAGLWICGELEHCDFTGKTVKHQACAVGLISIHGKETKKHSLHVGNYKNGNPRFRQFDLATYPSVEWKKPAVQALELLLEVRPVGYDDDYKIREHLTGEFTSVGTLSDAVVYINDNVISGDKKAALAWFRRARALAKKRGL